MIGSQLEDYTNEDLKPYTQAPAATIAAAEDAFGRAAAYCRLFRKFGFGAVALKSDDGNVVWELAMELCGALGRAAKLISRCKRADEASILQPAFDLGASGSRALVNAAVSTVAACAVEAEKAGARIALRLKSSRRNAVRNY